MSERRETIWLDAWYGDKRWPWLLAPLSLLFRFIAFVRRIFLTWFRQQQLSVPVIVVGNISLGGTGKTPLIIALIGYLQQRGFNPGVISRGYGGQAPAYPLLVDAETPVEHSGDEPLSIALAAGCKVCVDPDRAAAARKLEAEGCDLLLSDDGLQHYRLGRTLEIAVIDGRRGLGNGLCLPAGPLREAPSRLRQVDWVVVNGSLNERTKAQLNKLAIKAWVPMQIVPDHWQRIADDEQLTLHHLASDTQVNAVCGLGNPQRFYDTLRQLKLKPLEHDFPDHYQYRPDDLQFEQPAPVVMTTKDAVKCRDFAQPDWYALAIAAQLPESFWQALDRKLSELNPANQEQQ